MFERCALDTAGTRGHVLLQRRDGLQRGRRLRCLRPRRFAKLLRGFRYSVLRLHDLYPNPNHGWLKRRRAVLLPGDGDVRGQRAVGCLRLITKSCDPAAANP
jgi:hypothetical protein